MIKIKSLFYYAPMWAFIVLLATLSLAPLAKAANPLNPASVTLAWDKSVDDTNGPANPYFYRVYAGTNVALATNILSSLTNAYAGTNLSVTITNLAPAKWYFVATAFNGGVESDPSNVTSYTVRATKPAAPGGLGTIFVDTTIDLTGTNYTERGYFKFRITMP